MIIINFSLPWGIAGIAQFHQKKYHVENLLVWIQWLATNNNNLDEHDGLASYGWQLL
jgi:hypothetical protein